MDKRTVKRAFSAALHHESPRMTDMQNCRRGIAGLSDKGAAGHAERKFGRLTDCDHLDDQVAGRCAQTADAFRFMAA